MNQRPDQVASVLQRAVQQILRDGLQDPRVRGLISVTSVQMSPDGTQASVFLSVHPPEQAELTMHGIQHAARHIRSEVAQRVTMRRLPRLDFREDRSIKMQTDVLQAIDAAIRKPDDQPDTTEETQS